MVFSETAYREIFPIVDSTPQTNVQNDSMIKDVVEDTTNKTDKPEKVEDDLVVEPTTQEGEQDGCTDSDSDS